MLIGTLFFPADDDSTTSKFALLKLKQIHSSAQHEVKNYDGPCLPDLSDEVRITVFKDAQLFFLNFVISFGIHVCI